MDNIVELAQLIQDSIVKYQEDNPNCVSQESAELAALAAVMVATRGKYNPQVIRSMIDIERSVYRDDTPLRCS